MPDNKNVRKWVSEGQGRSECAISYLIQESLDAVSLWEKMCVCVKLNL